MTTQGLLYTGTYTDYFIHKNRLLEPNANWIDHVGSKTFVIREGFEKAYLATLAYHYPDK